MRMRTTSIIFSRDSAVEWPRKNRKNQRSARNDAARRPSDRGSRIWQARSDSRLAARRPRCPRLGCLVGPRSGIALQSTRTPPASQWKRGAYGRTALSGSRGGGAQKNVSGRLVMGRDAGLVICFALSRPNIGGGPYRVWHIRYLEPCHLPKDTG